jgi:hypothetical protein
MKVRRYRFSLSVNWGLPAGLRYENWPRERTAFLHTFRPTVERYRRRRRIRVYLLTGFMLGAFLLMYVNVPEVVRFWGFTLLVTACLGAAVTFAFGLRLRCPACRNRLEPAKGPYCPQCGSDQFQRGIHKGGPRGGNAPYCPSCDGTIGEEDADSCRSYRIRGCTHCGVMLDEMGL